jgi:hypothetical protein
LATASLLVHHRETPTKPIAIAFDGRFQKWPFERSLCHGKPQKDDAWDVPLFYERQLPEILVLGQKYSFASESIVEQIGVDSLLTGFCGIDDIMAFRAQGGHNGRMNTFICQPAQDELFCSVRHVLDGEFSSRIEIFPCQARMRIENFDFGHPAMNLFHDLLDGQTGALDDGLAQHHCRIDLNSSVPHRTLLTGAF